MPSCRPDVIPAVLNKVMEFAPKSILDVGAGHGKWGCLLHEYLKYWCNVEPVIDAVEVHTAYRSPAYNFYDRVHRIDITIHPEMVTGYDLVLMVDVIEHFTRSQAMRLLGLVTGHYVISTPAYWFPQGEVFGNPYEQHRSCWLQEDFENSILVGATSRRNHIIAWK